MSMLTRPFVNAFSYLRASAHERPIVFYALLVGSVGPLLVLTVPPIRKSYGWKPAKRIPITYPIPNRPRAEVKGYGDE